MAQSPELLRRLLRAKDRIDAAPHEEWTVVQLAEISAVTAAHFAREFKKAFGLPPHRYVLTRRVERAIALLRDTDQPITDIAYATGWRSLGTFTRVFRDITELSPGEYRTQARPAPLALAQMPECLLRATQRPDLKTAVSEKRRAKMAEIMEPSNKEDL